MWRGTGRGFRLGVERGAPKAGEPPRASHSDCHIWIGNRANFCLPMAIPGYCCQSSSRSQSTGP